MESGHAYGKALRTGEVVRRARRGAATACRTRPAWRCSSSCATAGLRSPHKLKLGVSGCARECAEARGKDVGLIATDSGWNIYVGGNGGFTPRHAELLVGGRSTTSTAIAIIDRYLSTTCRTADRLQRHRAPGSRSHDGRARTGIREIVVDDALGHRRRPRRATWRGHVDDYEDEWAAVLGDPERLRQFSSFVERPRHADPDASPYVTERGQRRPATPAERAAGRRHPDPFLIAPTTLEVRS
jgi:nitrite reductase (NADH) large subunit